MKIFQPFIITILAAVVFAGCAPDLVVQEVTVTWNGQTKTAKAKIANIGDQDAGQFMVYFNGDENPESSNYRPQVSKAVPGLAKGASLTLEANFSPLARPENNNLGNVYKITVLVDPKNTVTESNENNNSLEKPVP